MRTGLDRLLRPKSIAVIGGGVWCENVVAQCNKIGFGGEIFVVHPTRKKLAGVVCFSGVSKLPHAPDAAFVGVNRHASIAVVGELSAIGTGGAVCFASRFDEAKKQDAAGSGLQQHLIEAAGEMKIIGPNCYGFVNYLDGALLWPDEHGGKRVENGVAIITQSSNIAINLTMQKRGLPIAYVVTVGNQAQTGLSEIAMALLDDDRVSALGLHIEGIDDLGQFEKLAARARQLDKSLVCLKIGRSQLARAATISHTASLAGSDASAKALLARLSIAQVNSLPVLIEALKIVHTLGGINSSNIASMSCSGGEASLIADSALNHKVHFPLLDDGQKERLAELLGPMVALSNPLDYHTYVWGNHEQMAEVFATMIKQQVALGLVIVDIPRQDRCDASAWLDVIGCLVSARAKSGGNIALLASLPENLPEDLAQSLIAENIVPLCGFDEALAAIAALGKLAGSEPIPPAVLAAPLPATARVLSEDEAKALLANAGIKVPKLTRVTTIDEARKAVSDIGFPVVVKTTGIAHKSEAGGVALNLTNANQVAEAVAAMPGEGFIIEEMITDSIAELLVGVVLDPAHGYTLTIAAGGILSELVTDCVSLMVPASSSEVTKALCGLKTAKILNGYRGRQCANMKAVVDVIMKVQSYVKDHAGDIIELEINPLICGRNDAVAADALIKAGGKHV